MVISFLLIKQAITNEKPEDLFDRPGNNNAFFIL